MKRTLRDINAEILDLTEELIETDDPAEATGILDALDALVLQRDKKLDNIAYVRIQMKSDVKALGEEIQRLLTRKNAIENAGKRLDHYIMTELQQAGIERHKGQLADITLCNSPVSCEILDDTAVPDEFTETVTKTKIRRADAIRHYKQTGEILPGLRFFQNKHVRFK